MAKKFYIDLPNPRDLEDSWQTYGTYNSWDEALKIAKHLMGADDKGRINVISEFDDGYDSDDTVRSVMFQRMRDLFESWTTLDGEDLDKVLKEVIDIAFSTCGISEKEQNEPWI
jgi:hypothetical protein